MQTFSAPQPGCKAGPVTTRGAPQGLHAIFKVQAPYCSWKAHCMACLPPPGQPADLLPVPPTSQISPPQGLCTCSPAASNAPLLTLLELLARICPQVTFPGKPSLSSSCPTAASSPSSEHQSLCHQLPAQVSTCLGSLPATRLHFPDRQGHTPSHQYCVLAPPTRPCTEQVSTKSL